MSKIDSGRDLSALHDATPTVDVSSNDYVYSVTTALSKAWPATPRTVRLV